MVYLNCAATARDRPACVREAVVHALDEFGSCGRGTHASELDAARSIGAARCSLAELLGCEQTERVVFAANATEALNMAILGTVPPRGRVVATDWDHNSVLRPLYRLRDEQGVRVDFAAAAPKTGVLDLEGLLGSIGRGCDLVVVSHASNLTGNVLSDEGIARIAQKAHAAGALLLVDAAQTAGERPIDMSSLGVDLLAFTGHKALMGPQGTGGLAVAPGVEVRAVIRGGTGVRSFDEGQPEAYPEHLEAGTLNGHGIAGLGAAVLWLSKIGLIRVHEHAMKLTRRFVAGARELGATLYGDFPADLSQDFDHAPVVALNLAGWSSSSLADALARHYDIAVRAGAHCAPRMHRALGTEKTGAVRFSFGWFTTEEDVDCALSALGELTKEAR